MIVLGFGPRMLFCFLSWEVDMWCLSNRCVLAAILAFSAASLRGGKRFVVMLFS